MNETNESKVSETSQKTPSPPVSPGTTPDTTPSVPDTAPDNAPQPTKWRPQKARHLIVEAHSRAKNLNDMAVILGVTRLTARKYCKQLGLETRIRNLKPDYSIQLFRGFTYGTLREYAKANRIAINTLCYHLKKAQNWLWSSRSKLLEKPPAQFVFPPDGYAIIKVVNAVWKDPSLIDYPRRLELETGLSASNTIAPYINRCLEEYERRRATPDDPANPANQPVSIMQDIDEKDMPPLPPQDEDEFLLPPLTNEDPETNHD